jgi:ankyrin repeat protein
MVHKLIQSKMLLGNADELLLCYTINRTADYLVDCDKSRPRNQYTRVLETCAAKTMMYWRLVECVTTEKRRQIGDEDIRENALIAAIGANEMHIVQELLSNGVNPASNTPFFGEPLATAASLGSLALVQLLIDHWDWQRDDYLVDLRLMRAVEAAATAKHNMVLAKLLEYKDRINKSIYDDAIVRMVKRNQEATAELLLDLRQEDPEFDDEWFWVRLVRSAAEHGCRALLQRIMTRALSILSEEWINKALEDACSENHSEIVPIILSRLSVRKPINHAGSLFWAAWFGNLEVLGLLLDFLENDQHALRLALAGAVSRKRPEVVLHLLKLAGVSITDQDPPMRFTDIIRLMNPDAFSQVESRLIPTDSVYFPAEQPLEVPVKAQLVDVVGIFNTMGPQDPNDNSEKFLELFHRAMVSNALDSLSFLCENLTSTLATRYYKSSAVVQILIDFGRDISYARSGSRNM